MNSFCRFFPLAQMKTHHLAPKLWLFFVCPSSSDPDGAPIWRGPKEHIYANARAPDWHGILRASKSNRGPHTLSLVLRAYRVPLENLCLFTLLHRPFLFLAYFSWGLCAGFCSVLRPTTRHDSTDVTMVGWCVKCSRYYA